MKDRILFEFIEQAEYVADGEREPALGVAGKLSADGYAAQAIRPPTVPAGAARIRLSLTSAITLEEIGRLTRSIAMAAKSLPRSVSAPSSAASTHA
jgi:hypothetical protein